MSRDGSRPNSGGAKADRDRIVEQALTHELRGASHVTPGCIDAETLASWHDGALAPAQVSAVELHVSSCARCQAMLAAFARGSEVVPASAAPAPFWRWRWWLAPLAASAAAVTLWMVVPEQQQIASRPPERPTVAIDAMKEQAPAPPQAPADAPASVQPQKKEAIRAAAPPAESKAKQDSRLEEVELKDAAPPVAKLEEPSPSAPRAAAAPAPAPAAPAATQAREERADAAAPLQRSARFNFAPLVVTSPDAARRWRVGAAGIERSEDGGASWTVVRQSNGESLTAGAAPSSTVCWFAGRGGVVLVTSDGSTFTRVDLPERADVTAIEASDARAATVTTSDARRFRTDDSGRSWRPF